MRKVSEILSKTAISADKGEILGEITGVLCGKDLKTVDYFMLDCISGAISLCKFLAPRFIKSINDESVLVSNKLCIKNADEIDVTGYSDISLVLPVFDADGKKLGILNDIFFGDTKKTVESILVGKALYPPFVSSAEPDGVVLNLSGSVKRRSAPRKIVKTVDVPVLALNDEPDIKNIGGDLSIDKSGAALTKKLAVSEDSVEDKKSVVTENTAIDNIPAVTEDTAIEDMPAVTEDTAIEDMPAVTEDTAIDDMSAVTEDTAIDDMSAVTEDTAIDDMSAVTEDTAMDEKTADEVKPIVDNETVRDEETAADKAPVVDAEPVTAEESAVIGEPLLDEEPEAYGVSSVSDDTEVNEQTIVNDEPAALEESVIIEESTTAAEPKIIEDTAENEVASDNAETAGGEENAAAQKVPSPSPISINEARHKVQLNNYMPHRIIGNYRFLLGRVVTKNIYDYSHRLIIKRGALVTADTVKSAHQNNKLIELTLCSKV